MEPACLLACLYILPDPSPQDLRLVVRPIDTVVSAGSTVELYCIAEGKTPATTYWFKDDGNSVADGGNILAVGDGQVLELVEASAEASGTYTCSVSDGLETVNASATLIVIGKLNPTTQCGSGFLL